MAMLSRLKTTSLQLPVSYRPQLSPARFLVLGYLGVIFLGGLLLSLPAATVQGKSMGILDAVFMATSAVCVTGLSVVDTARDLSTMGQVVVLFLVQIGALGVMTMSTLFALIMGRRITLRDRLFLQEDLNQGYLAGLVRLVRYCIAFTSVIQGIGILSLWFWFTREMPWQKALYFAVFHSVSAFGNAGFDITGNSLESYLLSHPVVLTIALLIICGGLGFSVMAELYQERSWRRLSLQSMIIIRATVLLIAIGWAAIGILEWSNPATLGGLSAHDKIWASFFTAVTPRTAGFSVLSTAALSKATLFLVMGLMFIGAAPGSTGGGVKVTTVVVILAGLRGVIKGEEDVNVGERRLPRGDFAKAVTIVALSLLLIFAITGILLVTEDNSLMVTMFEVVSAFGTVGLSTGITPSLSPLGKLLLMTTMFAGRIGPMTLALAFSQNKTGTGRYRYPEEKISLG